MPENTIYDYSIQNSKILIKTVTTDAKSITIPEFIGTFPVTAIGCKAFTKCQNLRQINLPDSLKAIDKDAFYECSLLESITIPRLVNKLPDFQHCRSLKKITINSRPSFIPKLAFYKCNKLEEINIPDSVWKIDIAAFAGCSSLTQINLPSSIRRIELAAFQNSGLTSITILENTSSINCQAFFKCEALCTVKFLSSTTCIVNDAFALGAAGTRPLSFSRNLFFICDKDSTAHDYAEKFHIKTKESSSLLREKLINISNEINVQNERGEIL